VENCPWAETRRNGRPAGWIGVAGRLPVGRRGSHVAPAMAFIPYVPHEDAEGLLAELYARYAEAGGWIDNIIRIHSLNPPSMTHHVLMYAHLMRGASPLSRAQREMIAVTVSAANDCFY
jgi:alkylhydroperoxidase family enzyme